MRPPLPPSAFVKMFEAERWLVGLMHEDRIALEELFAQAQLDTMEWAARHMANKPGEERFQELLEKVKQRSTS